MMRRTLLVLSLLPILALGCLTWIESTYGQAPKGKPVEVKDATFKEWTSMQGKAVMVLIDGDRLCYVLPDDADLKAIEGTALVDFLQASMFVKFNVQANGMGVTQGEITDLTICEPTDTEPPYFGADVEIGTKVDKNAFNKYYVRGIIATVKNTDISVKCPNVTVKAKVADNCKIKVQSTNIRYAAAGHKVRIVGEEITMGGTTPMPKTPPKVVPKSPNAKTTPMPTGPSGPPRYIIATKGVQVTAIEPLTGKKKPGAK